MPYHTPGNQSPIGPLVGWGIDTISNSLEFLSWTIAFAIPAALFWHASRSSGANRRLFTIFALCTAGFSSVLAIRAIPPYAIDSNLAAILSIVVMLGSAALVLLRLPSELRSIEVEARRDTNRLAMLETAVNASSDGVMVAEATDGNAPNIIFANPAFEQMMGYSAYEAIGLSPSIVCQTVEDGSNDRKEAHDPEEEAEEAARAAIRVALRGSSPTRLEVPTRRKDRGKVWAEWQIVPVEDEMGRLSRWVAIIRDMTDRRILEDQLRESQKMDAIGRLAGGIAHDFNNLLTVIRGNSEILSSSDWVSSTSPELIDEIRNAADRAAGLVRQLLTFGRRQTARPVVVDLNAVVVEMAGMLRRLLGERIVVATKLSPEPIRSRIDRGQLEQVVMNLAVNARDAMPRGGTLSISTSAITDTRANALQVNSRYARLTVSDNGVGMSPEVRARIFEPFFTTKGPGQGTGLGLATAYGIVTHANGRIVVISTPGAGTDFHVDLPWCDEKDSSGTTLSLGLSGSKNRAKGNGRPVLLVEDEDGVRKLARVTLLSQGYVVHEAANAEEALAKIHAGLQADLLISDLTMPGIGGRELATTIREIQPHIGVVFISGYASDMSRLDSLAGTIFLAKPFTPNDLLKAASKAIVRAPKSDVAPVP